MRLRHTNAAERPQGPPLRCAAIALLVAASFCFAGPHEDGKAALQAGDPERAYALLSEAARGATDATLERDLGDACAGIGRLGEAEERYRRSLELQETSGAHHNLGVVLGWLGEGEAAAAEFEKARALNPAEPGVDRHLANILFDLKRFPDAAAVLERMIAQNPNDAAAHIDLAELVLMRLPQREEQAGAHLERALELEANAPRGLYLRGVWRRRHGQPEAAAGDLRSAIAAAPELAEAHYELAQLLRAAGKDQESRREFESFERLSKEAEQLELSKSNLAADRSNPDAWILLGVQQTRVDQLEEAARSLQRALELEPGNAVALYDLAVVRLRQDRRAAAIELLEQAVAADPERAEPRALLARLRSM
jgi:tetratricopeptide (TPR) repeat protein